MVILHALSLTWVHSLDETVNKPLTYAVTSVMFIARTCMMVFIPLTDSLGKEKVHSNLISEEEECDSSLKAWIPLGIIYSIAFISNFFDGVVKYGHLNSTMLYVDMLLFTFQFVYFYVKKLYSKMPDAESPSNFWTKNSAKMYF